MLPEKINQFLLDLSDDELRSLARELGTALGLFQMPKVTKLELIVTEDCPFRCDYCFVKGKNAHGKMDIETAKTAIDLGLRLSGDSEYFNVTIFGGEPLMDFPLFQQIVEYASHATAEAGKKVDWAVTTNGLLITEEVMLFCQKHSMPLLLSIDGDRETHDRHRRLADGGPTFDRVFPKIELMRQYQYWLGTRMTLSPDTIGNLASDIRFLHEAGVNQFLTGPNFYARWTPADFAVLEAQWHKVADYYLECKASDSYLQYMRVNFFEQSLEDLAQSISAVWGCEAGRDKLTVNTDGKLYGCSKFAGHGGVEGAYCLGDVWRGITKPKLRAELADPRVHIRGKCMNCEHAIYCTGGCPAQNFDLTGSIFNTDTAECEHTRMFVRFTRSRPDLRMVGKDPKNEPEPVYSRDKMAKRAKASKAAEPRE